MMTAVDDAMPICINEKLASLSQASQRYDIFKVPTPLRKQKEEDYVPILVGIGPYNHGQGELTKADKLRYLKKLLQRRGESDVKRYVEALREVEKKARQCYGEKFDIGTDEFVEMMLIDGCFIVELLRTDDDDDGILRHAWMKHIVVRDLLLLENQLPFFVLCKLYTMTPEMSDDRPQPTFVELACEFFKKIVPGSTVEINGVKHGSIKHLLHLLHEAWVLRFGRQRSLKVRNGPWDWSNFHCATELLNAGTIIKKSESREMFNIQFKNGRLELPQITIDDRTESLLRNLLAYEHCSEEPFEFSMFDYVLFMDRLIDSPKDAMLLTRENIIINYLGDDEVIAKMFNRLTDPYVVSGVFYYDQLFNEVNEFGKKKWNRWMATLRNKYFDSPWSVIAVIAAAILLLTALFQTAYTIASFYNIRL